MTAFGLSERARQCKPNPASAIGACPPVEGLVTSIGEAGTFVNDVDRDAISNPPNMNGDRSATVLRSVRNQDRQNMP